VSVYVGGWVGGLGEGGELTERVNG
jgi:hypothetical protein